MYMRTSCNDLLVMQNIIIYFGMDDNFILAQDNKCLITFCYYLGLELANSRAS